MAEEFELKENIGTGASGEPPLYKDTFREMISLGKSWAGRKLGRLPLDGKDIDILKNSGLAKFNADDYLIELSIKSAKPENYKNFKNETNKEILQRIRNLAGRIAVKMSKEDELCKEDDCVPGSGAYGSLKGDTFS